MVLNYQHVNIKHGDVTVLNDVNLTISEGDFVFITGRVGSGKSSLLSTIYAELPPFSGEAQVLEYKMSRIKQKQVTALRKQLGIVFQSFELLPDRTVSSNLRFVLRATGWKNKAEIATRISEVLSKVELLDKMDNYPFELSGGEQQRVAIARALLNNPKLIIADEPTGNLDYDSSTTIMQLLNDIRQEGTAVIMSTHNLKLIDLVPNPVIYECRDGYLRDALKSDETEE